MVPPPRLFLHQLEECRFCDIFPDGVPLHSPGEYPKNSHLAEQIYAT
jgi:hypothetical protein